MDKEKELQSYEKYGFKPPMNGKYKRKDNRIYFAGDFKDGEEIEFCYSCKKASSNAIGNAFYKNKQGISNLINISDVE